MFHICDGQSATRVGNLVDVLLKSDLPGNTNLRSTFSLCLLLSERRWAGSVIDRNSMLVCAVLCTIQAVKNIDSPVFARMVVSLLATYGVFVVSSVLALDPWYAFSVCNAYSQRHIITCFAQYILFSPSASREVS